MRGRLFGRSANCAGQPYPVRSLIWESLIDVSVFQQSEIQLTRRQDDLSFVNQKSTLTPGSFRDFIRSRSSWRAATFEMLSCLTPMSLRSSNVRPRGNNSRENDALAKACPNAKNRSAWPTSRWRVPSFLCWSCAAHRYGCAQRSSQLALAWLGLAVDGHSTPSLNKRMGL